MSANALETRNRIIKDQVDITKRDISVTINAVTVLIAALGLLFGGLACFVAFSADQEAAVTSIWVRDFHAYMKANGYDVPPLPEKISGEEQ